MPTLKLVDRPDLFTPNAGGQQGFMDDFVSRYCALAGGWYAASLEPFRKRFGEQLLILLHDDVDDDPRAVYDAALVHVGAVPDFVPPDFERVRFSHQQHVSPEPGRRPLTRDERRELWDYFADDVAKLEKMIDRDLSLWDPNK